MGLLFDRLGRLLQACGVSVGVCEVGGAAGLSCFAAGVACEACPLAASLGTRATRELGHPCFLAVQGTRTCVHMCLALPLARGKFGRFRSFPVPRV